jgi:hypothetical protein
MLPLLHHALGSKACCGSSSLALPSFPGTSTASYSLKLTVRHLFGNHTFSAALYVVFSFLSMFANSVIQTCHMLFISSIIIKLYLLLLFVLLGSGIARSASSNIRMSPDVMTRIHSHIFLSKILEHNSVFLCTSVCTKAKMLGIRDRLCWNSEQQT